MAAHFEAYQHEAYEWLHDLMRQLRTDNRDQAARIFRAVLHAIRDRIPAPEAIQFAAQLPIIWKGIYFDGFKFHPEPPKIRDAENWLNFIRSKTEQSADFDFPTDNHVAHAFDAVMRVLDSRMSYGQMEHLRHALHEEILEIEM